MKEIRDIRVLNYSPKINPLVETKQNPVKTKKGLVATKMSTDLVDPTTGEHHSHALIHKIKEVDDQHFVKVFAEGVKRAFELNRTESRVFQKILEIYEAEKMTGGYADSISLSWFNGGLNGDKIGMSDVTFHRGLKALLNKGFISPKMPNIYWVNPSLFFKGDRVAFVTEYRRTQKSEKDKLEDAGQQRLID
jgi:hypothetical protein